MEVDDETHSNTKLHRRNKRKTSPNSRMKKMSKNTPKITKKKNNPYNLEMRFTHKDQLY
jgi:hypothetical protein